MSPKALFHILSGYFLYNKAFHYPPKAYKQFEPQHYFQITEIRTTDQMRMLTTVKTEKNGI